MKSKIGRQILTGGLVLLACAVVLPAGTSKRKSSRMISSLAVFNARFI